MTEYFINTLLFILIYTIQSKDTQTKKGVLALVSKPKRRMKLVFCVYLFAFELRFDPYI